MIFQYDELEEAYEQAKESSVSVKTLSEQLETSKIERDSLIQQLNQKEAERMQLEARIIELEAQKEEAKVDDGWNDDGWGEEEKVETEEVLQLRQSHLELTQKIRDLEHTIEEQRDEGDVMAERIIMVASEHAKVEMLLKAANEELEKVKKTLALKEKVESEDDSEVDKLQEAQKILEMKIEALQNQLIIVKEEKEELASDNAELQDLLKTVKMELEETKLKLSEAESAGWNDDEGWGNEETKELEAELATKNEMVEQLREQIAHLQREVIAASESADMSALEELEKVREELKVVSEQNGLLKDSEARLLDHADEFAVQMEQYREKCSKLTVRIKELETELQKVNSDGQQAKISSDELVTLRFFKIYNLTKWEKFFQTAAGQCRARDPFPERHCLGSRGSHCRTSSSSRRAHEDHRRAYAEAQNAVGSSSLGPSEDLLDLIELRQNRISPVIPDVDIFSDLHCYCIVICSRWELKSDSIIWVCF